MTQWPTTKKQTQNSSLVQAILYDQQPSKTISFSFSSSLSSCIPAQESVLSVSGGTMYVSLGRKAMPHLRTESFTPKFSHSKLIHCQCYETSSLVYMDIGRDFLLSEIKVALK